MLNTELDRLKRYEASAKEQQIEIAALKKKVDQLSFVRVALLLVEIGLFVGLVSSEGSTANAIWSVLLLLPIFTFAAVVRQQNKLEKQYKFHQNLLWVFENEIALLQGKANGYDDGTAFEDENHPYLSDLDIFGKSSLYALINRGASKIGVEELAKHLATVSNRNLIVERQEAIKELTEHIDSTFAFRANLKGYEVTRIEEIKQKLGSQLLKQVTFTSNSLLKFYVKTVPYLMLVLFLVGLIFGGTFWSIFGLMAFANAMLTFFYSKQITTVYYGFSGSSGLLSSYADAIEWTEQRDWKSKYIKDLFLSEEKVSAHIKTLAKIIVEFDARLNFLLYAVLNFFLLWDLKCCIKLGNWTRNVSDQVAQGLDRIGYFEELISFATLNCNHPDWVFPAINQNFSLKADELGHPLIPTSKRVDNSYALRETATVDIITGSNMAGKSTFLRTVGINMVLAYAGAPVCAKQMDLSIFRLLTYMRIKDNLIESTSTFKAELNRLKMILSEVELHPNAFVLIDEMLRGTNSKDKFDGSKAFIEKLIKIGTPTLFATHDLQLSELEQVHPNAVRNFHFDIQLVGNEMEFDYLIKQGPCTKFNAAILLKQIGLG
ncbi:MAG: DNA mismatch repair protein MutS [Pedobacter sp.]|uniref:MutS-related protein n=1 Tax=Pedobacter sp. TaxID=1411316 RepID=UPI002808708E|nr:DNA mismatch repair protein MutS [Pedobacter sp.]MDQ8005622.1 DNA mismatch repair protein MutS [Pedobacter sp.]